MRKVAQTQRHFKDSTSTFPDSAASGAEPEPPSAREDGNARAILWGQCEDGKRRGGALSTAAVAAADPAG